MTSERIDGRFDGRIMSERIDGKLDGWVMNVVDG